VDAQGIYAESLVCGESLPGDFEQDTFKDWSVHRIEGLSQVFRVTTFSEVTVLAKAPQVGLGEGPTVRLRLNVVYVNLQAGLRRRAASANLAHESVAK
jgi:hypothetical protein